MQTNITTKFGIGDTAYGYYYGRFYKFKITEISIKCKVESDLNYYFDVEYNCTAILPGSSVTFNETFPEKELFTIQEIKEMLKKLDIRD